MNLKSFYNKIKTKKLKYFFGSKDIFLEIKKNFSKFFKTNDEVLDLGCGGLENFMFLKSLKFKTYLGVDWIKFNTFPKDKRFDFKKSEITNFLFKNKKKFNLIVCIGTLEHFVNPWKVLGRFKKNLKSKGKIIISYPNYYNPRGMVLISLGYLCGLKFTLSDKYFFSPNEIETFLRKKGFKNIKTKSIRHEAGYKDLAKKDLLQRVPKMLKKRFNKKKMTNFISFFTRYTQNYNPNKFSGHIIIITAEK